MRRSFLFTDEQVDQLLDGLGYSEEAHGISFDEAAIEGIDTNYMGISNELVVDIKNNPNVFHTNNLSCANILTSVWKKGIIDVIDYGAILSGQYAYLVPVVIDIELVKDGQTLKMRVGKVKTVPVKRNLDNFLHPTGCILANQIKDIIKKDTLDWFYGFYYNTDNFISSTEVAIVYLNFTMVDSPVMYEILDRRTTFTQSEIERYVSMKQFPPKLEERIYAVITKALKEV